MAVTGASIEMNNEIILLRRYVRQARICVITKLIREAKRLQTNRGDEKILDKKKNKAEKCLREVSALKHIKEDEISKFGILQLDNLQHILQDPKTGDKTRAIVKVVRYKCLNTKIVEFLKNFPNSKEYISSNKEKHSSRKKKKDPVDKFEKNVKQVPNKRKDLNNPRTKKGTVDKEISLEQVKKHDADTHCEGDSDKVNDKILETVTKVVSKEATVKRFTDILQESSVPRLNDEHKENNEKQLSPMPVPVTGDDFFLNFNRTVPDVNVLTLPQENDFDATIGKKSLTAFQDRNAKRMFSRNEGKKKKVNDREQNTNNKNALYHRHSIKKGNTMPWEQKKQDASKMKKTSGDRNFEHTRFKKNENENLHPSWAAKRKQQIIVKGGFQGKKVRFDDN